MNVLFLCTGNSCRSQMAEGWARALKGNVVEPYSAGIETHGMNPRAVQVMAEAGVDIADGALKGLTARAVVVLDENNKVVHSELVPEIANEPNYDAALRALK